jgi:uncharacterized protein YjaG (DUF416 family)
VISCLNGKYYIYGSSPRFLIDWRWYKDLVGDNREFNELALANYYQNNLNLLDSHLELSENTVAFGKKLEELGSQSRDLISRIQHGEELVWQDFFTLMQELCAQLVPNYFKVY